MDFGGFDKTLQNFDKEISSKGKPVSSTEGKGPVSQKQLAAQVYLCVSLHSNYNVADFQFLIQVIFVHIHAFNKCFSLFLFTSRE